MVRVQALSLLFASLGLFCRPPPSYDKGLETKIHTGEGSGDEKDNPLLRKIFANLQTLKPRLTGIRFRNPAENGAEPLIKVTTLPIQRFFANHC